MKKQMLRDVTLQGRLSEIARSKIERVRESKLDMAAPGSKRLKVPNNDQRMISRASSANFDQKPKVKKTADEHTVKYAYVTFRSMHDMNRVLKAYNVSKRYRCLVNYLCCCCCTEEKKKLQERVFYNQWIDVRKASEPDEIKWENLGVSG